MKRYTFRAALHDATVFCGLRLEYRRANENRHKDRHFGWLSRCTDNVLHNNGGKPNENTDNNDRDHIDAFTSS